MIVPIFPAAIRLLINKIVPYSANLVKREEGASGEMDDFFLPKQNSLRWPPWSNSEWHIRYITCGIVQME